MWSEVEDRGYDRMILLTPTGQRPLAHALPNDLTVVGARGLAALP